MLRPHLWNGDTCPVENLNVTHATKKLLKLAFGY